MTKEKAITFKKGSLKENIIVRNNMIDAKNVKLLMGDFDYLVFKLNNQEFKYAFFLFL